MTSYPPYLTAAARRNQSWTREVPGSLRLAQLAVREFLANLPRQMMGGRPQEAPLSCAGGDTGAVAVQGLRNSTLLVAALSGGPDSLAVAAALSRVAISRQDSWKCVAATVDHGWRDESAAEARAAATVARELGFASAAVLSPREPSDTAGVVAGSSGRGASRGSGGGPEGAAREMRWALLASFALQQAREQDCSRAIILTGHTLDDQAETVLLRLARGASKRALSGMATLNQLHPETGLLYRPLQNGSGGLVALAEGQENTPREDSKLQREIELWVGRPLLGLRRENTVAACNEAGLVAAFDPTNRADGPARTAGGDPLRRAALRDQAMPVLTAALGQDPAPALARVAQQNREDEAALQGWAHQALQEAWPGSTAWHAGQTLILQVAGLASLPLAVLKRVLRSAGEIAGWHAADITAADFEILVSLVKEWQGQGPVQLPGLVLERCDGYLHFIPAAAKSIPH